MLSTQNVEPTTQRFFFVDEKSSSKGKRSHAMKHHLREKKSQQRNRSSLATESMAAGELSRRPSRTLPWTKRAAERIGEADSANPNDTESRVSSLVSALFCSIYAVQ
jgi:ribosomal protein L35